MHIPVGVHAKFFRAARGFSLLELLVASTILTVGLVSLAQLLALAVTANAAAGQATYAAVLAAQKIEDLRAMSWESLQGTIGDSADSLDRAGRTLDNSSRRAAYTRRWSVDPLPADPNNTLVIEVIVRSRRDDTRIITVRTRTAP